VGPEKPKEATFKGKAMLGGIIHGKKKKQRIRNVLFFTKAGGKLKI